MWFAGGAAIVRGAAWVDRAGPLDWRLRRSNQVLVRAIGARLLRSAVTVQAARVAIPPPRLTVSFDSPSPLPLDATLQRTGPGKINVRLSGQEPGWAVEVAQRHVAAYSFWLLHCPPDIDIMTVTLSDGEQPSRAMFGPSCTVDGPVPIPDSHFFRTRGFDEVRRISAQNDVAWSDRSAAVRWRGASSASGRWSFGANAKSDPTVSQRQRLILAAREINGLDAAFVYRGGVPWQTRVLALNGMLGAPIASSEWIGDKFAIDIDGQTNTWGNLLVRLHQGCCVLKIESQFGYRQWYYHRLRPWEHFVPVSADLSDLADRVEWVRTHDAAAAEIARNGRDLARSMTFESVITEAAEIISSTVRGEPARRSGQ